MRKGFLSSCTGILILINVVVFILSFLLIGIFGEKFFELFALRADLFFSGYVWTIFTSMFLHSNSLIIHIFANMFSLFFLGMFVEHLIGKKRFFWFYIISGIFAGIFFATLSFYFGGSEIGMRLFGSPTTFALGASGAIFGLVGLIAVLTPRNRVYLIAGPLIAIVIQSILNIAFPELQILSVLNFFIFAYFIFSIYALFTFNQNLKKYALPLEMPFWILPVVAIVPLVIIGLFFPLPIGNSAHFGGLLIGLAYGIYLRKKYPRKTKMIRHHFSR